MIEDIWGIRLDVAVVTGVKTTILLVDVDVSEANICAVTAVDRCKGSIKS